MHPRKAGVSPPLSLHKHTLIMIHTRLWSKATSPTPIELWARDRTLPLGLFCFSTRVRSMDELNSTNYDTRTQILKKRGHPTAHQQGGRAPSQETESVADHREHQITLSELEAADRKPLHASQRQNELDLRTHSLRKTPSWSFRKSRVSKKEVGGQWGHKR